MRPAQCLEFSENSRFSAGRAATGDRPAAGTIDEFRPYSEGDS